ncbi:MAG: OpgC domain-containing protein, partial [Methylobacterium sp.]|nr:OpgC domain-containing protein [Methylobacterium sp.]
AAALFTVAAFLISAPWREIPGYENVWLVDPLRIGAISKTDLSIIRLIDVLAKFWLVMVLIRPDARWLSSAPARMTALMGRHSLEVFALGTIGSIAGGIVIVVNGYHPAIIAAAVLTGIALMIGMGAFMEWRSGAIMASRKPGVEAAPRPAPALPPTPERRAEPVSSRSTLLALDPRV